MYALGIIEITWSCVEWNKIVENIDLAANKFVQNVAQKSLGQK